MIRGIVANSFARPMFFGLSGSLLLVALLAGLNPPPALGQTTPNRCAPDLARPQDQLWLVSARGVGCTAGGVDPKALHYWHYVPGLGWQRSSSEEFFASDDPGTLTQIWIHGNQIEQSGAFGVGWTVYNSLARRATIDQPLRFVIWSWPSERFGGLAQDVREKAARTGPAAFHLARFIDAIHSDVHVGLIGYSFGARIAVGSLQLLAGGPLNGRTIPLQTAHTRPAIDVVLIAAAVDSGSLLPGCSGGKALSVVNRLLLVNNSCDKVLRFYRFLYGRRSGVEALGRDGLAIGMLGANARKVSQFDACCLVGPEHYWANYFASPAVTGRILPYIFNLPTGIAAKPADKPAAAVAGR
jgi:hypothetical protein